MGSIVSTAIITGVLIPIFAMVVGLVIAMFAINRNYQVRRLEHELRMKALEKGYDIPAMPGRNRSKPNYPFAWPFVFIGFGLALIGIYAFNGGEETALGFGLISLFLGAALFASRFYGVQKENMIRQEENARGWVAPGTTQVASEFPEEPPAMEEVKE